jgi:Amt family ammonium transporter
MSLLLTLFQETPSEAAKVLEQVNGDMGMLMDASYLVFLYSLCKQDLLLVESGMTRSKNAVNIAMKNLLDICVGSLVLDYRIFINVW